MPVTVARVVAEFLAARGVERVYGLCGGHVLPIWDEAAQLGIRVVAVWDAALGSSGFWAGGGGDGPAGPAYIDFPTDLLRETLAGAELDRSWMAARTPPRARPDPAALEAAADLLRSARRPAVIS